VAPVEHGVRGSRSYFERAGPPPTWASDQAAWSRATGGRNSSSGALGKREPGA